jgi:hypothetical protein
MSTGAILQSQVQAMREVYPSMSAAIDTALYDAIARARASKASYQLPPRAERGVRGWFGKGPVPLAVMKRAQETAKATAAKQQIQANAAQQQGVAKQTSLTQSQKGDLV